MSAASNVPQRWLCSSAFGVCCLVSMAIHAAPLGQSVRPDVSRAVEVSPPADWHPDAPLFAIDGGAAPAPAVQRMADRPKELRKSREGRAAVAGKPVRKSASKSAGQARPKNPPVDVAQKVRKEKASSKAVSRGVRKQRASALTQKKATAKPETLAAAASKVRRPRGAAAVQPKQERTRLKRAAPQAPRSAKPDRSPPTRATRQGGRGDTKETVRRAR